MAKRVTNDDIIQINEVYAAVGTYAETARQTGFSASTVKKYVNVDYVPQASRTFEKIEFNHMAFPEYPQDGQTWRDLMMFSEKEKVRIKDLQKEIMI